MTINFEQVELHDGNPEPRCPCVLLLDTSGSMNGLPIAQLNQGLATFEQSLVEDELALVRVELAVITFGPVQLTQDFVSASQFSAPTLRAGGDTPMGGAVQLALDKIEERKQIYRNSGLTYYRPWLFLITDGQPTDGPVWQNVAMRVKNAESRKQVACFSVGVEGANMAMLSQLSLRPPLHLQELKFRELFTWLSASLSSVSHSMPTQDVPLQSPMNWAEV